MVSNNVKIFSMYLLLAMISITLSCSGSSTDGDVDTEDGDAPAIVMDLAVIDFTSNSVTLGCVARQPKIHLRRHPDLRTYPPDN
jgi:hypothetical protein